MNIRIVILGALMFGLAACSGARMQPPDIRYYTLEYESPVLPGKQSHAAISLGRFGVAPEFSTTKIVYRDLSFGRQEYTYHQWRSTPQNLVMDYLRRDMQRSGLFLAVSGPGSTIPFTHHIEGIVEQWMELDSSEQWQATAELTVTLLDLRAKAAPSLVVFQRTYRNSSPCAKKNPSSVAESMSRVMQTLSEKIIADVYAAVR